MSDSLLKNLDAFRLLRNARCLWTLLLCGWLGFSVSSADDTIIAKAQASHFLSQASMGGTVAEIDALAANIVSMGHIEACEAWMDDQFTKPRGKTLDIVCRNLHAEDNVAYTANSSGAWWDYGWWSQAVSTDEQLRYRVGFALSQIAVVSDNYWEGLFRSRYLAHVKYYQRLMDVAFTSHREFLTNITYSPMMGVWLSHAQNAKGDEEAGIFPDENFAREILQLFSMGVYEQDASGEFVLDFNNTPIENYTNDDIKEFAKVFTGLSINDKRSFFGKNLTLIGNYPLQMVSGQHHTGEKKLLNGTTLPANQGGNTDIAAALNNIAYHPSTAPNFSRLLIKRLTSSNPSNDYIKRVTDAWYGLGDYGSDVEGDFQAVLKAILLDPEARNALNYTVVDGVLTAEPVDALRAKVKEPILKMTQFLRFANPETYGDTVYLRLNPIARGTGQPILGADTVFNFYDADFSPAGGPIEDYVNSLPEDPYATELEIVAPELQILPQNIVAEHEKFYQMVESNDALSIQANKAYYTSSFVHLDTLKAGAFEDSAALLQHLNVYLCNGQLPADVASVWANTFDINVDDPVESYAQLFTQVFVSSAYSVLY